METYGFTEEQLTVRDAIFKICANFSDDYWMERDQTETYPHELHAALAKDGWIGIALPEELGGAGLGISEATMMLQTIAESGAGLAGAQSIHANVYATQPVAKFATPEQRKRFLTKIVSGEWRTCFGVTEPNTGLETLKLTTTARRDGDGYLISGQKIWISSAQVATKMVLLARTTPLEEVKKPSEGLSMFYVDFDLTQPGLEAKKIRKMGGRAVDANQVFFDNYRISADSLIGQEGQGFKIVSKAPQLDVTPLTGTDTARYERRAMPPRRRGARPGLRRLEEVMRPVSPADESSRTLKPDQSDRLRTREDRLRPPDRPEPSHPTPPGRRVRQPRGGKARHVPRRAPLRPLQPRPPRLRRCDHPARRRRRLQQRQVPRRRGRLHRVRARRHEHGRHGLRRRVPRRAIPARVLRASHSARQQGEFSTPEREGCLECR